MRSREGSTYLALMCERVDVSDHAGAATASAILKDFEVIGDDNFAEVVLWPMFSAKLSKVYNFCYVITNHS